jgi:multidrug efflux pump subunit AcrA (membrane-fusion protein)
MTTATSAISDLQLPDSEKITSGGNSRFVRFVLVAGALFLAGGSYVAWLRNPPWLQAVRGAEYDIAPVVVKGHDDVALELSGFVVPYRKVNMSPRIPGTITQLPIDVGQKVKKGDLLAQLDDASYQADMEQAVAGLQAAQSTLDEAKNGAQPEELEQARTTLSAAKLKLALLTKEVERARKLPDSTSPTQMDQLLSTQNDAQAQVTTLGLKLKLLEDGPRPETIKRIESQVASAEALVKKARYFLDNARITAPLDGTVLEKNAEVGEILRPEGLTTSLCILADLSVMEVEVDVQERDLQKIDIGRACTIIPDAYANREYHGKIDRIQPQVNRQRGVVRVTIRIDEPDEKLLPEMNVRAMILNPASDEPVAETLWIPDAAVTRRDGETWVYVLEDDRAIRRDVELGDMQGRRVQAKSGLTKDDQVVLAGDMRLVDGQTIRRKKAAK